MLALILLAVQDAPVEFAVQKKENMVTVQGALPSLPDEAIVDVVLQRCMNEAHYLHPILKPSKAEPPARQYAEVRRGKFTAPFQSLAAGYYSARADFAAKFQRSMSIGKMLSDGKLAEVQAEKRVFVGTDEELIESLKSSAGPVETIAKKLLEVMDAADDPKTDPFSLPGRCDKISSEIDQRMPLTGLPASLRALKGHAEHLATYFRGMGTGKPRGAAFGGGNAQDLPKPDPKAQEFKGPPPAAGGIYKPKDSNEKDKTNSGNERIMLGPTDDPRMSKATVLGERYNKNGSGGGNMPETPVARIRHGLEQIQAIYLRETALIILERARDLIKAGDKQVCKLSEFHASLLDAKPNYKDLTTVNGVPLSAVFEEKPEDVDAAVDVFDQAIRNRIK
jgi:hypothetical protein